LRRKSLFRDSKVILGRLLALPLCATLGPGHCRAKSAQIRLSRPDSGLGLSHFSGKSLKTFNLFPFRSAAATVMHKSTARLMSSRVWSRVIHTPTTCLQVIPSQVILRLKSFRLKSFRLKSLRLKSLRGGRCRRRRWQCGWGGACRTSTRASISHARSSRQALPRSARI